MVTPRARTYNTPTGTALLAGRFSAGSALAFAASLSPIVSAIALLTASAATAFSMSLQSPGVTSVASTITVTPNGPVSGGAVVTISASNGAALGSSTLTWSSGDASAKSTTITRSTDGVSVVSITNNAGLSNTGTPISFVSAPPVFGVGKYRSAQTYLFQPVSTKYLSARYSGGTDYYHDAFGPTHLWVDPNTGTAWANPGGDWLDATLTRQGTTPWFSVACNTAGTAEYSANVTALVSEVELLGKPLAMLLDKSAGAGYVVTPFDGSVSPPSISVTYINGATATLACRIVALNNSSTTSVDSTSARILLPAFVEFEQPIDVVASATLNLSIEKAGSTSGNLRGWLLDPQTKNGGAENTVGIADEIGTLDSGASSHPDVIMAMTMIDASVLADFVSADTGSWSSEANYDPQLFGGTADAGKWPTSLGGKFHKGASVASFVTSSTLGQSAVAAGIGAIKFTLPADSPTDGSVWDNSGSLGADAHLMLPADQFGLASHLRVRYYQMLGAGYDPQPADRKNLAATGTELWSTLGGKFGLGFDGSNSYGGGSGAGGSGGGYGWQLRDYWKACDSSVAGPARGGLYQGVHWYDFQARNPVGHRYGTEKTTAWGQWGQKGLRGAMLYSGRMQCVEKEIILNTLTDLGGGSYSYAADGEYRVWVDDVLAYEQTGLVFRTSVNTYTYDPSKLRPCRALGVTGFWLNLFHGGQTPNPVQLDYYITQIIVSNGRRIGPMRPAYSSWRVTGNNVAAIGSSTMAQMAPQFMDWGFAGSNAPWDMNTSLYGAQPMYDITSDCGNAYDYQTDTFYGGIGGGHAAINIPANYKIKLDEAQYKWLERPLPTDGFTAIINGSGNPSQAALAAAYPAQKLDSYNGEWIASWPSWTAQPGATTAPTKRQKEAHHTGNSVLHVPAAACGNSNGVLLMPAKSAGGCAGGGAGGRAYRDLDKNLLLHTINEFPESVYYGGLCYFGGSINRVFGECWNSTSPRPDVMRVMRPQEWVWRQAICGETWGGGDTGTWILDGGPRAHEASGLIVKFVPYNPATGVESPGYNATSSAFHVYAVRAVDVIKSAEQGANPYVYPYSWTKLTVNAAGNPWPTMQFRGGGTGSISWEYNHHTGKMAAVNGDNNSTTIWELSPPAGYTDPAVALAGTWTLSRRTLNAGIPEGSNGSGGTYSWFVYNRLRHSRRNRCYVYESSHVGLPPIAISE